jgi:ATP-binding cassette subfamily E protein 1
LGKNGTGKTTFVKCLAGLEEVELNGKKTKIDLDLKISYKPQYLPSDSDEIVRDIIIKEKIEKSISSEFHLEDIYQKRIKNLSGGELQRFSIARCLAKEADIYLIDEPSAYLDVEERISLAKTIKDFMMEKEKICFVVDHDLLLISYLADSILVFSGEASKIGKSSEVFSFEKGISELLKSLDITLRKDKDSGRPRINKKDSVLDREQKRKGNWAVF